MKVDELRAIIRRQRATILRQEGTIQALQRQLQDRSNEFRCPDCRKAREDEKCHTFRK